MKKNRICTILMLLAFGLIVAPLASALAEEAPVERYVMSTEPSQYPGIAMNYQDKLHETHVEALGGDCTACHYDNDEQTFMGVAINDHGMTTDERRVFLHNNCVSCHTEEQRGPSINECRSCHSTDYAPVRGVEAVM